MNPVEKALWYIENHRDEEISLETVAEMAGCSRFHLVRAFTTATGFSVMRYVRGRRLSEAAKTLCGGSCSVLEAALEAGYGSHEAFTRAFSDWFGTSPDRLRRSGSLETLNLVEPLLMNDDFLETLGDPRIVARDALLVAGLKRRYSEPTCAGIPDQWRQFVPLIDTLGGGVAGVTYGVLCNGDDEGNIDYVSGVEVRDFSDLPPGIDGVRLPARTYAVFHHGGHVSDIRKVWHTIFARWAPSSGRRLQDAPQFERYGEAFDPRTGAGGFEIWVPVED